MASFEEGKSYLRLAKPLSGHTDSIDSTLQVSDTRYRVTAEETVTLFPDVQAVAKDTIAEREPPQEGIKEIDEPDEASGEPVDETHQVIEVTLVDQPVPRSWRREVLYLSITDIDHFTPEYILETFPSREEWRHKHLDPVWDQNKDWWRMLQLWDRSVRAKPGVLEDLVLTEMVRHTLLLNKFAILPEEAFDAQMAWHTLMPDLLEASTEIRRTRGYLVLLVHEIKPYKDAWKTFWCIVEKGTRDLNHLQRVLNNLFMTTIRFYFLMCRANNSFHRATSVFRSQPVWYEWDCEAWRNEVWEFYDVSLKELLKTVDGESDDADEEGSDSEDEGDNKRQLLPERVWLRQQMGLF